MAEKSKAKAKKALVKPAATDGLLGVADLAKLTKLEAATVRVKLRDAKVKKTGKSYGWKTQAELKKVAAQITA